MLGGAQSCAGVNGLKESPAAPVCSITQVQINAPLLPPFPNLFPASRAILLVDHFETNRASFCYLVMAVINEAPTSQDEVLAGVVNRLARRRTQHFLSRPSLEKQFARIRIQPLVTRSDIPLSQRGPVGRQAGTRC